MSQFFVPEIIGSFLITGSLLVSLGFSKILLGGEESQFDSKSLDLAISGFGGEDRWVDMQVSGELQKEKLKD